jgi:short-subunit dehydrogenase
MLNNKEKNNKFVLITGATQGIGYEFAKLFASDGINIILIARNLEKLKNICHNLSEQYSIKADYIAIDLSQPFAVDTLMTELNNKELQIDILVNNAGFNVYGEFNKTSLSTELNMIQLNLIALTTLTKLLLPNMIEKGYGKILNIGSTGSFVPGPLNAVYCATKAYILSFSEAIAEELNNTGVTCTVLCPGATNTKFANKAGMENIKLFKIPGAVMNADVVAKIGYNALYKNKRQITAGFSNKILVFFTYFTPRIIMAKLTKILMSK